MPTTMTIRVASMAGLTSLALAAGACGGSKSDGGPASCPAPAITAATTVAGPATDPGACQLLAQPSTLAAAQVQHLGTHAVGETVSFTIPANTAGFSIVSQGVNAYRGDVTFIDSNGQQFAVPNAVVPVRVYAPGGAVFFDDNKDYGDPTQYPAFYASFSPWSSAFTVPNTTPGLDTFRKNGVPAGTWKAEVSDYAAECAALQPTGGCASGGDTSGTYDMTVITRPGPLAATGTVDVRFYLVTDHWKQAVAASGGSIAAAAAADPKVTRLVSTLAGLYNGAGVCLGSVTMVDVAPWARAKYAASIDENDSTPCGNLAQMFTLSESVNSLNFFLVDDIVQGTTGSGGNVTVGIDGSIPGPSSIGGTINSGAVVNVSDLAAGNCGELPSYTTCGADSTAYVAAHEGGHWMGLYHVTEATGDSFDPLADTGTCDCTKCAPPSQRSTCAANAPSSKNPYLVTVVDCSQSGSTCTGVGNLMFWLLDRGASGQLTTEQSEVMRSNPVVR